jgi:molecular chaperone DnaK (HSP70)
VLNYDQKTGKAGNCRISLSMELDANGILTVTARLGDKITSMDIDYRATMASKERAQEALHEALHCNKDEDRRLAAKYRARLKLTAELEKQRYTLEKVFFVKTLKLSQKHSNLPKNAKKSPQESLKYLKTVNFTSITFKFHQKRSNLP